MQPNFKSTKSSSLIKSNENARKKARRQLIGSIFMLLVALIILLNVTAKTRPIIVKPKNIEIKRNESASPPVTTQQTIASEPIIVASGPITDSTESTTSTPITRGIPNTISQTNESNLSSTEGPNSNTLSESPIVASDTENKIALKESEPQQPTINLANLKPRVVSEGATTKLTPQDILEGKTKATTEAYFVQVFAGKDKKNLNQLKITLNKIGISTTIKPVVTDNGTIYRLRVGPFKTKDSAEKQRKQIENKFK